MHDDDDDHGMGTRQGSRRGLTGVMAAILLLLAMFSTGTAVAQTQQAADLGFAVEVGFGRGVISSGWNLVEVTAAPRTPLAGALEARASTNLGFMTATRDVEVAGGAVQVIHLLLPPADDLHVWFVDGSGTRTVLYSGFPGDESMALVGGLGQVPSLPTPLSTAGTDRPVRGVAVDPAALSLGPRGLDSLDVLAVSSADLAGLSDVERNDLEVALVRGLELVVTVRPGDGPLPLRWNPVDGVATTAGVTALTPADGSWIVTADAVGGRGEHAVAASAGAGHGRVTALAGDAGDTGADARQLWSALVQVRADLGRPLAGVDQGVDLSQLFGGEPQLPGLGAFALFAVIFVVVVGPINALVLRRLRRRELAWVTVPAMAILFTAVAVAVAAGRTPTETPVMRAAWWLDGVGQETTLAAIQAPARGIMDVTLPGSRDAIAGQLWSQTQSTQQRAPDTTTVQLSLQALQVASVVAWGDPGGDPPLDVTATLDGGVLRVEVTNSSGVTLDDVRVRYATNVESLGVLEPEASVTVALDDLAELARPRAIAPQFDGGLGRNRPKAGPSVAENLLSWDLLTGAPGQVWVTATADTDLGLAVPQVGGGLDDRGSFVAVGTTPTYGGGFVPPHQVVRDVLRTQAWAAWRPSPLEVDGGEATVLRYRLPAASGGELVSTLHQGRDLRERFLDPWAAGCFEVIEFDVDGNPSDPIERCGDDIACPNQAMTCGGSDTAIEACFEDGRCQTATRISDLDGESNTESPLEVFDHAAGRWVPVDDAFPNGRGAVDRLASPLGDVLVRDRQGGPFDFGQRGIAWEVTG